MHRRFAALLLSTAMILGGMVAAPCMSSPACALAQAVKDCCKGTGAGLSAQGCCDRPQQLSRNAAPATTAERPTAGSPASFVSVAAAGLSPTVAAPAVSLRYLPSRAAPPGSTLVAQHTSLLL